MRDVFTIYAAPHRGARLVGDAILESPEPASPSQTLWCEGLPVARIELCADGFVALHLAALQHLPLYIRLRDVPALARLVASPAQPHDAQQVKKKGNGRTPRRAYQQAGGSFEPTRR